MQRYVYFLINQSNLLFIPGSAPQNKYLVKKHYLCKKMYT